MALIFLPIPIIGLIISIILVIIDGPSKDKY